ncbi:MAG: lytic transglycosylase domain-containing protein [Desulfobacterales bacterium]|nr:lytic transglycosylase domain-containing protein [Desulfobacterales bacterium]
MEPGRRSPSAEFQAKAASLSEEIMRTQPVKADTVAQRIDASIQKAAIDYDLPAELIRGVIQAESNFQVRAVSPAGAQGLMQLMPATARDLGVDDPFDIRQNIDGGARYLRQMLDMFDGDVKRALSAYNAGPGTVMKYDGQVPYPETRHYVRKVMLYAQR